MLLTLLSVLCVLCALTTIVTFVLYVRARMALREEHPDNGDRLDSPRNAELDRREHTYRSIHFITLFAVVVLGVIILVILSDRAE